MSAERRPNRVCLHFAESCNFLRVIVLVRCTDLFPFGKHVAFCFTGETLFHLMLSLFSSEVRGL
jgi:hypothetical protein